MLDDTPQTRVVLADKAGGSGHRHILDESHDERFEQKREAGSRPCPRHVDQAHATVGTVDAGLLHRVVHRAVGLAALGTGKPATGLEVDLDIEPLLVGVELGVHHHPRRHQAECELEQIDVAHLALSSRLARRYRAAVLVAVKNKPLRARDPRAFLTATRHVGGYSVRPGRKDGSAGPNKRIDQGARRLFLPSLVTHSRQRGGENSWLADAECCTSKKTSSRKTDRRHPTSVEDNVKSPRVQLTFAPLDSGSSCA